jgi:hypothetical protein
VGTAGHRKIGVRAAATPGKVMHVRNEHIHIASDTQYPIVLWAVIS